MSRRTNHAPRCLLALAIAACATSVLWWRNQEPETHATLAADPSEPAAERPQLEEREHRRSAATGVFRGRGGLDDAGIAASPGGYAVLPGLARMPRDWRDFGPERIDVAVAPGLVVPFARRSFVRDEHRGVWTGEGEGVEGTLVAVGTENAWTATVAFDEGNEYLITVAQGRTMLSEVNPDLDACGNALEPFTEVVVGPAPVAASMAAAADTVHTSDVLFLYDAATESAVEAELERSGISITAAERIDSIVRTLVGQANEDLRRSEIDTFRWSVAGVAKVPAYDTGGDRSMTADLNAITYTSTEAGRVARDEAVKCGADQTVLFVNAARDYAGLAWRPGHHAVCIWGSSHTIVAHEMGHNLDCNHDRVTAGAADGGGYNYGHRYRTSSGRDTGTIMSYAGSRLPYFSNPNVIYQGTALGLAAGESKAADNARTIREHAGAMAGYREAVNAPEITKQPVGGAVRAGQAITLTVTAVGGSLSYQWYKDQTVLSGATSANYRKDGAAAVDAGSYTVTVSNPRGSVASSAAIIAVSAASGGVSSDGPDSASGTGGGGAPSVWFLGMLAVLGAIRRVLGPRRL